MFGTPVLRRLLSLAIASFVLVGTASAAAATTYNVPGDSATINGAIALASAGDTVNVAAGSYNEDVVVNKDITLTGAGVGASTISGPIGGGGSTVSITASGATVEGFTITRDGNNTTDWNNAGLNSGGVTIQGLSITGVTIQDNQITGMRTAIDINASGSHSILDNVIDDNRTGLIFRNQTDNMTVTGNKITNNWTVGILFLDASGGTNVPVQTAANSTFSGNNISGNWYGQVVDRQSGGSLLSPGSNVKDFSGNYFGTTTPVVSTANSAEPGYAAQIPVAYGGSAVAPGGQPDILGPASANIDFTPYLGSGVDTSGDMGFQPDHLSVFATADGAQSGATGRITEAISLVAASGTVSVNSGTYGETATFASGFDKDGVTLTGSDANDRPVITGAIAYVSSTHVSGLTLADLIVRGEYDAAKHAVISFQGSKGVDDLTVDHLDIDGEGVDYGPTTASFGGRNGLYGYNLGGTVTISDTVFENLKGYCAFDTNCNTSGITYYPSAIHFSGNTVRDSSAAIAFRGQSAATKIPTATVSDSTFENIGPDDNSYGGVLKVKNVSSFTMTGSTFDAVANSNGGSLTGGGAVDGIEKGAGVAFNGVDTMTVTGNTFENTRQGILLDGNNLALPTAGAITGNTFVDNDYAIYLPAGTTLTTQPTIAGNRIVGSTVQQFHNGSTSSVNIENNWWGCNTGLNTAGCGVSSGTVDADPWIVVSATSALDQVQPNADDALAVSTQKNSDGAAVADQLPDASVSFASTGTATGTFNPVSGTIAGGSGGSTWTSDGSTGTATLTATFDGQAVSDTVDVAASAPAGEAAPVPDNPVVPVSVTSGDAPGLTPADPVSGSVEVPAGGNGGGVVSIQEIPTDDVPSGSAPTGFATAGISFEIHAPTQTVANPLKFTFLIHKAATSAIQDEDVQVFRNGAVVDNCTPYDGSATTANPDPCVVERSRLDANTLQITVLSSAASFWVIGGTTPETVIDSGPGGAPATYATNDASPTFTYHAVDSTDHTTPVDADFQCAIDLDVAAACGQAGPSFTPTASFTPSPDLTDGVHTFHVQASDGFLSAGNIEDQEFFVDTVAPDLTAFTGGPGFANGVSHLSNASSGTVTWTRSDAAPSSGYDDTQCNLDGAGFVDCTTGTSQDLPPAGLTQGSHDLVVKVVDMAGNEDATPSTYHYEIDTVAPQTTIDTFAPVADPSNSPTASFTFSGDDNQAGQAPQPASTPISFECRLDTPAGIGAWTACNAGNITYPGPLTDGLHTFNVRATDATGNTDGSVATHSWTVDRTLPVIHLRYPRDGGWYSKYKDVESDWDCTDTAPGTVVSTTSTVPEGQAIPRSLSGLNNFNITCTDNAGNVATSATTYRIKEFHQIVNRDHPIAYYRLDEPSGASAMLDLSGNNNDGEFKNATAGYPFGISGDGDTARYFAGEGGYGYVNGIADPKFAHTLGAWVRFTDVGDAEVLDHGYEGAIYLKDQHFVYRMMGKSITGTATVVANQWYFVAGVWNGYELRLWSATGTPGIHTLPTSEGPVTQARQPSAESTFYVGYGQDVPWLRGAIDEVFYYDSALSTDHINELWLADPPAEPTVAGTPSSGGGGGGSSSGDSGGSGSGGSSSASAAPAASDDSAAAETSPGRPTADLAPSPASSPTPLQTASAPSAAVRAPSAAKVRAANATVKRLTKQYNRLLRQYKRLVARHAPRKQLVAASKRGRHAAAVLAKAKRRAVTLRKQRAAALRKRGA